LSSAATVKDRWRNSKQLLHSTETVHNRTTDELNKLWTQFSTYFIDRIATLKRSVASNAAYFAASVFPDPIFTGCHLTAFPPATVEEVNRLITAIRPKTSSVDYIPTSHIKSCPVLFSEIICKLANLSFENGVFPETFKSAAVTPLIKEAGLDPDSPSNCRPISNLNNFSKILERLVLSRLQPHVLNSPHFNHL